MCSDHQIKSEQAKKERPPGQKRCWVHLSNCSRLAFTNSNIIIYVLIFSRLWVIISLWSNIWNRRKVIWSAVSEGLLLYWLHLFTFHTPNQQRISHFYSETGVGIKWNKKNRLLSLWKGREVCISFQESLFAFYVYLLPPQWHTSNLYFDCFVFWGHLLPRMSISLLLPPRVDLFMTFWRINPALALAFHRSLKRIFTRASRCFPWWDLGNRLTDARMGRIRSQIDFKKWSGVCASVFVEVSLSMST